MLSSEIKTFFKHFIKEFKKREKINFDRLKPFYDNIKKEYSNVLKKGSSKQTHFSILRTDSSGVHPRRQFIKQLTNTPSFKSAFSLFSETDKVFVKGILENTLDNSAMNSWFNQNGETPLTKFLGNSTTDHLFGYFTPSGNFDFNVVIRSILYDAEKKYLSFSVGSAITAKSFPEKEYEECLLKAKAMQFVLTNSNNL